MRMPMTMSFYIGRQCLVAIAVAMLIVLSIIGLIELVELLRRASHKENEVPFIIVLEMAFLKMPHTAEKVLPFAVLIGSMVALTRLTKSSELVVARASGVSVWQFLTPAVGLALLIGVVFMTVFNPISAAMISRFEVVEGKYITGRPSLLSISPSGLWLRQVEEGSSTMSGKPIEEYIIHAKRISQADMSLSEVMILTFQSGNRFIGRINAPSAQLEQGHWQIENATMMIPGKVPEFKSEYQLSTDLSINEIQESFASPKTLSFWELPGFISMLERAGFSALRHKLYFQSLLSGPVLLAGMVLIAAVFSLRLHRRGKINVMIVGGILTGFVVYFTTNLVYALGYSGALPIALAAWTPPLVVAMVAVASLLHLEDG
ncbi:MAG: LPS export ABC transporter permease LptG [Rickettsiales bacterium]|nr:LPS export ABC transporter permease LptG [Rickettsiales bacterium]